MSNIIHHSTNVKCTYITTVVDKDINFDLTNLLKLADDHALCLNPEKSTIMLFGRAVQRERAVSKIKISLAGKLLQPVNEAKSLGLLIDDEVRFRKHIGQCIKKAFFNLKTIYANKNVLNGKPDQDFVRLVGAVAFHLL